MIERPKSVRALNHYLYKDDEGDDEALEDKERSIQTGPAVEGLSAPAADLPAEDADIYQIPQDKMRGWYRDFRKDFGKVAAVLISLIPVFLALVMFLYAVSWYRFPKTSARSVAGLLLLLSPSMILFLIRNRKKLRSLKIILAILCLLVTPLIYYWSLFSIQSSTTDRPTNYMVLDEGCDAKHDAAFLALFPKDVPLKDMPGSRYHYSYAPTIFGEADNIYAEWRIEDGEAFEREVRRAEELFGEEDFVKGRKTLRVQRGSYRCLLLYDDTDRYEGAEPFTEPDSIYYWYCLFAWDEGTNTVRYYFGRSWKGDDPPYYLSLDWN